MPQGPVGEPAATASTPAAGGPGPSPRAAGAAPSVMLLGVDLSGGGGVNRVIRDLSAIFSEELACDTTVVSGRSQSPPSYPLPDGVKVEYPTRPALGLLRYFLSLLKLRRRRFDYAVSFWTQDNILLLLAFAFSRTRLILCEHTSHYHAPRHVRLLRRLVYPAAWRVTVLNRAELAHYRRWLSNVVLLPNPVEPCPVACDGPRENLIVGVGHLIARKAFADLLKAAHRSGIAARGWRLAIIGEGPQRAGLERLAVELGLPGIEFVAPSSDIHAWYARARIIVVSSHIEVFSLVLTEAIACGVVPLAYAADGPAFILEDYPDHLVPVGDVDGLADGLAGLAESKDLEEAAARIRASVRSRMSRQRVASLWRELLAGKMD
jgi:GalNAc-alpha-(1->4)-GalNAc-alpha-(1->3)-diNAcBac-PP-undecaprenol alpha-1,4-N-acetyl-D-galactosaminyltransferase